MDCKELEERVHLGTRSERVPQNEERGRNEILFFAKEREKNNCLEKKERPIGPITLGLAIRLMRAHSLSSF